MSKLPLAKKSKLLDMIKAYPHNTNQQKLAELTGLLRTTICRVGLLLLKTTGRKITTRMCLKTRASTGFSNTERACCRCLNLQGTFF